LDRETLERAIAAAGIVAPVRWDDVTGSTNATALAMAADGAPAWTLVAAGHQTEGRGRLGRSWADRPGHALLCSVVVRPTVPVERLGLVSLAAGAAMATAIAHAGGPVVRCKWPNDLLVGGAKVGGILAESEVRDGDVRHVVVGAGVNLEPPPGLPGAGAIGDVVPERILAAYLASFRQLLDGTGEGIVTAWRAVADTLGRRVEGTTVGGDAVLGVAADLDGDGALLVDTGAGRVRIAFGEVAHVDVRDP
jgi:BirA family transcriptional regulator, biotin operon repressor / biotin---[acetyl-CoA-carboxylase] ligase